MGRKIKKGFLTSSGDYLDFLLRQALNRNDSVEVLKLDRMERRDWTKKHRFTFRCWLCERKSILFILSSCLILILPVCPLHGSGSGLVKEDDAVGIGAFGVVVHAPAVGGFGEFLVVDQDQPGMKSGGHAAANDGFLQLDFAEADFADFKGDVTSGTEDAVQFTGNGDRISC